VQGLLLAEIRMLYKNNLLTQSVQMDLNDKFVSVHNALKSRMSKKEAKETIEDLMQLVGGE